MSESEVKLLNSPYGEVSYESFRKLKRAFADKSAMIKSLDDNGMTLYPVLLRPRRFGKSTFIQMLKCFYDISYADRYEELFYKTNIFIYHIIWWTNYRKIFNMIFIQLTLIDSTYTNTSNIVSILIRH